MTDWGAEPPLTEEEIRTLGDVGLEDWYWILHPNASFNGDVGILHFTTGKAAFAPQYIHSRNRADWFEDDGLGGLVQSGMITPEGFSVLWILMLSWHLNGFTIAPMNGGSAEYDEVIPDESP